MKTTQSRLAGPLRAIACALTIGATLVAGACDVEDDGDNEERFLPGEEGEDGEEGWYYCDFYDCDPLPETPPVEPVEPPSDEGGDLDGGGLGDLTCAQRSNDIESSAGGWVNFGEKSGADFCPAAHKEMVDLCKDIATPECKTTLKNVPQIPDFGCTAVNEQNRRYCSCEYKAWCEHSDR
ncbi:MAG: hypothetical protein AAF721_39320 [Myxococcota bacterium]